MYSYIPPMNKEKLMFMTSFIIVQKHVILNYTSNRKKHTESL